jgi:iron complex outermembrane receptor protein
MFKKILMVLLASTLKPALAQAPVAASEADYLADMPIVLSVSRLPQRLDEAPGAVTVIDRAMIRLSGARDVADLMRLVPGFQTSSSFERIAPQASYHGAFTSFSNHLQVLVDGRSVYSPYFVGSTEAGLQTVALEDIERIEVLRGSNSAAYGARAMLGVINIVTRHTVDTLGVELGLGRGEHNLQDVRASIGWGQPDASFRLGVDRRSDAGLKGANGNNAISRVNFRADLLTSAQDEVLLRAGGLGIAAGKGEAGNVGDPLRAPAYSAGYLQIDWRRSLGGDEALALHASSGQEVYKDSFPYVLMPGLSLDINASGRSRNDVLSFQHTWRRNADVRLVWGAEWRREKISSKGLYNTEGFLYTAFSRIFSNLEWRLSPQVILNAGAMAEKSSVSGDSLAPRLMVNWHMNEAQTLRAGVSRAFRPPSTYENFADVRFITPLGTLVNTQASGQLSSESVLSREMGYLGRFPRLGLSLDVRLFNEHISDLITQISRGPAGSPKDYANKDSFSVRGLEYQLKWRPWPSAQIIFNQALTRSTSLDDNRAFAAPKTANTLTFLQKLAGGAHLSLMHQDNSAVNLPGSDADHQAAISRTDLRLSMPMRFGANWGELALVLQNLGNSYPDFFPHFEFERRAFVTLRVER